MGVKPLDLLIRDRVQPVLAEWGFKRCGRVLWTDDGHGNVAFLEFRTFRLGRREAEFLMDAGVEPRIYRDFNEERGYSTWPPGGLWRERVRSAGGGVMQNDQLWLMDLDDEDGIDQLLQTLRRLAQELVWLLQPENMLARFRDRDAVATKSTTNWEAGLAFALAAMGPSQELDEQLRLFQDPSRPEERKAFDTAVLAFLHSQLAREHTEESAGCTPAASSGPTKADED